MQARDVPEPLSERLGIEATAGLLDLLHDMREDMTRYVIDACTERFERRLVEETSKLRVELAQGLAQLRAEMAVQRGELLKWMFLFWIGQLAAMVAVINIMLRGR